MCVEAEGHKVPLVVDEGSLPLPLAVVSEAEDSRLKRNQTLMHALLIEQAALWLAKTARCTVVITDMVTGSMETPDAIGWKGSWSTLIECKASRSDFMADRHKIFRRVPEFGMGDHRYFCAPAGMIRVEELPEAWGLLEWSGKRLKMAKKSAGFRIQTRGGDSEKMLLISALRRLGGTSLKGVSVRHYTLESKGCATLGILPEVGPGAAGPYQQPPTTANAGAASPQPLPTADEGGLPL